MTGSGHCVVERVRLRETDIAIEGRFELPPLAQMNYEDQVFVAAFVKCHGSIKQMEKLFGVSYPTIKSRLNRIGKQLDFVDVKPEKDTGNVLDELAGGEISVEEALERLK
ncbi:MAG: DUF2089 domain-containing protein [Planctomycetes bacterium]|nr:DUF2089 domain-containing protein [Planctomycetota bacterium]